MKTSHIIAPGKEVGCYKQQVFEENLWPYLLSPLCLASVSMKPWGFPSGTSHKEPTSRCRRQRDALLVSGLWWSPGGGHDNSVEYSCQENPMDRKYSGGLQSIGLPWVGKHWRDLAIMNMLSYPQTEVLTKLLYKVLMLFQLINILNYLE